MSLGWYLVSIAILKQQSCNTAQPPSRLQPCNPSVLRRQNAIDMTHDCVQLEDLGLNPLRISLLKNRIDSWCTGNKGKQ